MTETRVIVDQEGIFIECENEQGESINAGEWRNRSDGLRELIIKHPSTADIVRRNNNLTDALRDARLWVELAVTPIRNLSPTAAEPGESMLRKIDAALKGV